MYSTIEIEHSCFRCEYMVYDTFHNETWCDHRPAPEGLNKRLEVEKNGTCEYWSEG